MTCASIRKTIVDILMQKLEAASEKTGIKEIAIAGGVSEFRIASKANGKTKIGLVCPYTQI